MRRRLSKNTFPLRRDAFLTCAPRSRPFPISMLIAALVLMPTIVARGQGTLADRPQNVGSWSCASAACHGQPDSRTARPARPFPSRQAFVLWVEHDPHARAAQTLDTAAFDRILRATLPSNPTSAERQAAYERCAACHDPLGITTNTTSSTTQRGIGCESCHGAASEWLGTHYQLRRSEPRDAMPGMIDLRDPLTRAKTCVTCHVGDETHDVDHDLLAVGHPPLRFELNGYHDLLRIKHWDERRAAQERGLDPALLPFSLWEAGQVAAVDAVLRLAKARAEHAEAASGAGITKTTTNFAACGSWPEFAEFDCQACHQRLRVAERQTTAVRWQPWYVPHRAQAPPINSPTVQPFTATPGEMAHRADAALHAWRNNVAQAIPFNASSAATWQHMLRWLRETSREQNASSATDDSWYLACHDLLGLRAVLAVVRQRSGEDAASLANRLEQVAASLRFGSREFEWPAYDWHNLSGASPQAPWKSLSAVRAELRGIATEFQQQLSSSNVRAESNVEDRR